MKLRITRLRAALWLLICTTPLVFLAVGRFDRRSLAQTKLSYEELTGSRFLPAPKEPFQSPQVRELSLPTFENATSIWGATGRDVRGHAYVPRLITGSAAKPSAVLVEYDASLNELSATPLKFYLDNRSLELNHGIIALPICPAAVCYLLPMLAIFI